MIFCIINFNENVFGEKLFLYSPVLKFKPLFVMHNNSGMGNMAKR